MAWLKIKIGGSDVHQGVIHDILLDILAGVTVHEPQHDNTNNVACAPREDSDQHEHVPSLI